LWRYYILNLHTEAFRQIEYDDSKYFESYHNTMLHLGQQIIGIYDADKLYLIFQIPHNNVFVYYHKKLDVLITEDLQLFIITNYHKLKCVNMGINYIVDRLIFPNLIMEIIVKHVV